MVMNFSHNIINNQDAVIRYREAIAFLVRPRSAEQKICVSLRVSAVKKRKKQCQK
jgi:hypothetical protein